MGNAPAPASEMRVRPAMKGAGISSRKRSSVLLNRDWGAPVPAPLATVALTEAAGDVVDGVRVVYPPKRKHTDMSTIWTAETELMAAMDQRLVKWNSSVKAKKRAHARMYCGRISSSRYVGCGGGGGRERNGEQYFF